MKLCTYGCGAVLQDTNVKSAILEKNFVCANIVCNVEKNLTTQQAIQTVVAIKKNDMLIADNDFPICLDYLKPLKKKKVARGAKKCDIHSNE